MHFWTLLCKKCIGPPALPCYSHEEGSDEEAVDPPFSHSRSASEVEFSLNKEKKEKLYLHEQEKHEGTARIRPVAMSSTIRKKLKQNFMLERWRWYLLC